MLHFSLISPAYAQDASGLLGNAGQFLPLVMIFGVFYFLLIRPQQQKQKEARNMLAALKRGDRVVTGGGIVGVVQKANTVPNKDGKQVPNPEVEVEIAPNVRITVMRDTISSVIAPPQAATALDGEVVPQLAGLKIANIDRNRIQTRVEGVIVVGVEQGSTAAGIGLRPGDIIAAINRQRVRNINEFLTAMRGVDRAFQMSVVRGDFVLNFIVR